MIDDQPAHDSVIVGCLREGCVCCSEFGKCTRCYAADAIQRLTEELDFERAAGHVQLHRAEAAEAEVERLKGVLGKIADGDVPREAVTIWRSDGIHSKHDKCGHERVMYDDCDNCTSEFARSALEAKP